MEQQQLRPRLLASRVCVFAFLLNYSYSLFLALYAEPIIGLNTPAINVIYGLVMGLPLVLICIQVLTKANKGKHSIDIGEGGTGRESLGQRDVRSSE